MSVATPLSLNRRLQDWQDDTATWNGLVNGIQADDVEAQALPDDVLTANTGLMTFDETKMVVEMN